MSSSPSQDAGSEEKNLREADKAWEICEHNPRSWHSHRKWLIVALVGYAELLTHTGTAMFAPCLPQVAQRFHAEHTIMPTLALTVYVLGYAVGPLVFAPMSEVFGRADIYKWTSILYLVWCVACAVAPNMNALIAFRFFSGVCGAAPISIGATVVADLFAIERKGFAMSWYAMGPIVGNLVGPPVGGVILQHLGYKWVFWIMAILVS